MNKAEFLKRIGSVTTILCLDETSGNRPFMVPRAVRLLLRESYSVILQDIHGDQELTPEHIVQMQEYNELFISTCEMAEFEDPVQQSAIEDTRELLELTLNASLTGEQL